MSLCALSVRHQCIIASAILKYECALVFAVSLPFCSLWHLRGISGWFGARLSPPPPTHFRGTSSIDSSPRADAFLSLSFRCLLPFNPSALRCLAELGVFIMCRDNDKKLSVHERTVSRWDKVEFSTAVRQMGCLPFWLLKITDIGVGGILRQGGDGAKTQRQANTHCQVHGCCHKKRFPQRFLWNTHGPDALLPAKRVWILESPLAHLAVAAHRPVAERKDKIDFSLHHHVLCVTLCLSKLVWEVRGCHIAVSCVLSTPLTWWRWWLWWWQTRELLKPSSQHGLAQGVRIIYTLQVMRSKANCSCKCMNIT